MKSHLLLSALVATTISTSRDAGIEFLDRQTALALSDARDHGFRPQPVRVVPGADHGPLPEAVLAWCDSLRHAGSE